MGPHEEATEPRVEDLVTQELPCRVVRGLPGPSALSHLLCGPDHSLSSLGLSFSICQWEE